MAINQDGNQNLPTSITPLHTNSNVKQSTMEIILDNITSCMNGKKDEGSGFGEAGIKEVKKHSDVIINKQNSTSF